MTSGNPVNCDVLVIGAGFGGVYAMYKFRKLGLKVHAFDMASDFGGVWFWNRYPGARVDSEFPYYQLSIPEIYEGFDFTERFPTDAEIRRHFAHIDKVLNLRPDVTFNAKVNSAVWDKDIARWQVGTEKGYTATCKYLFFASGLLHRRHYPDIPGLNNYEGNLVHSAFYPQDLDCTGKRVAVIGAGATSVQIVSTLAKNASHLTMFMRRPSYCLPMKQRTLTKDEQTQLKAYYPALFKEGRDSATGFPLPLHTQSIWKVSPEEREKLWESLWARGAFNFLLGNYLEMIIDLEGNRLCYNFWRRKIHERMHNKDKAEIMAPAVMPYPFGTKRAPLEADYYDVLDRENVEIVQLLDRPFKEFNKTGVVLADGSQHDFDVVVCATGFDSFSGSLTTMGLTSTTGEDLKDIWGTGLASYLGMTIAGFPNTFMVYSPHAPTAFSNGPTILEAQVDWCAAAIAKMEKEGIRSLEATSKAEKEWVTLIEEMGRHTLYPLTNSWWTGMNTEDGNKKPQMLTYAAGINTYEKTCLDALDGWKGFVVEYETEGNNTAADQSIGQLQKAGQTTVIA